MYAEANNGSNSEHQMLLLKLQGSAAQILALHVNDSGNRKKRMEAAGVLAQVEDCRKREDMMMVLDRNMTTSYLPALFGVEGVYSGLHINLNKRPEPRLGRSGEEEAAGVAAPIPEPVVPRVRPKGASIIRELGPAPPMTWREYNRIPRDQMATLLLANNNPMFSLCHEINPYPDQCLKEVLPGASMVVVPTFDLFCQLADTLLTEALMQVARVKLSNGEDTRVSPVTVTDVREGLRQMDVTKRQCG
ncbi:hypothetical protein GNI_077660 [Gregarina niphandrodes]|uniref:Uncharacterized protein n=1 Tax=Gregarina niphandrodes TaxID=110365 RepID=A0A023B6P3_GRENI|nr:hypothetical protein GNI_077660 [Gregarina niphandrodes]EZG66677.1 hypothetical protein GNI_077660 [Gregarina niphandrodes]|eukprot:XP_011130528.1 hypothetical protein GNI_077660 [Gregarina niphandrodes]